MDEDPKGTPAKQPLKVLTTYRRRAAGPSSPSYGMGRSDAMRRLGLQEAPLDMNDDRNDRSETTVHLTPTGLKFGIFNIPSRDLVLIVAFMVVMIVALAR